MPNVRHYHLAPYLSKIICYYFRMPKAKPVSISLSPAHEDSVRRVRDAIRSTTQLDVNRSFAIQVALLSFKPSAKIKAFVETNLKYDSRRTGK